MSTKPFIVAIDGIDGVGKSSLVYRLTQYLRHEGETVTFLAFPNGDVRESMLSGKLSNTLEIAEAVKDQVVEQVNSVKSGVILLDRYSASTYVYQVAIEPSVVKKDVIESFMREYPKPDVHVFLYADLVNAAWCRVPESKRNLFDADNVGLAEFRQRAYLDYYTSIRESGQDVIMLSDTFVASNDSKAIWESITQKFDT